GFRWTRRRPRAGRVGRQAARLDPRPVRRRPDQPGGARLQRARGRAGPGGQGAGPGLRRCPRLPLAGGHGDAPHRRPEVEAAAHQPGGRGDRVQPHVRGARRAGEPPAHVARARHRRGRL
ncbi:MAG: DNA primase, partial [uncultured Nocardioidaceae bacterium]